MARFAVLFLALILSSCAYHSGGPSRYGGNDYAISLGTPYPREVRLARQRLTNFLDRANTRDQKILAQTPYVAVQAYAMNAGEIPGLPSKLTLDRVRETTYESEDPDTPEEAPAKFLLVFNRQTGELASPQGMFVIDTPPRGRLGQIGGFRAIYAGTGWW